MVRDAVEGTTARAPTERDLDAVYGLLEAAERALHGEADLTRADLEAAWARPSFDLAAAAVVVEDATGVVGYAAFSGGVLSGGVHPRAQRRGIGAWLLDWGTQRLRETGASSVGVTAPDADAALRSLLEARGFRRRHESWLFWQALGPDSDAPATSAHPVPPVPDGMRLRNPDLDGDARRLFDVIEPSFAEWPDREPETFEDFRAELAHGDIEPATSWLVEDADGDPVAVALSMTDRGWGWLSQLAVRRDHRGRGLGSLLLQRCVQSYRDLGLHTAGLGTDSRTGARDLYERNGFVVQRSFTRWALPLR